MKIRKYLHSKLPRFNMRRKGVVFGRNLTGKQCSVQAWGRIELGDDVELLSYPDGEGYKTCLLTWDPSSLIKIGNKCVLNGTVIHSRNKVIIGDNCLFGAGVVIMDSDFHTLTVNSKNYRGWNEAISEPVVLGNNVWVCRNSIVLKGVRIGDNSVIAASSVVTKSVPSNQLFGGNPARFIKVINE